MQFRRTDVLDAWLVDPSPHVDSRGRFMRAWCEAEFAEQGIRFVPRQSNLVYSRVKGTVRGQHFIQAKIPVLVVKLGDRSRQVNRASVAYPRFLRNCGKRSDLDLFTR